MSALLQTLMDGLYDASPAMTTQQYLDLCGILQIMQRSEEYERAGAFRPDDARVVCGGGADFNIRLILDLARKIQEGPPPNPKHLEIRTTSNLPMSAPLQKLMDHVYDASPMMTTQQYLELCDVLQTMQRSEDEQGGVFHPDRARRPDAAAALGLLCSTATRPHP